MQRHPGIRSTFHFQCPAFAQSLCQPGQIQVDFSAMGTTIQTWTVPAGVTEVTIHASGTEGGNIGGFLSGGSGAEANATFNVTSGEMLDIHVGVAGSPGGCGAFVGLLAASGLCQGSNSITRNQNGPRKKCPDCLAGDQGIFSWVYVVIQK